MKKWRFWRIIIPVIGFAALLLFPRVLNTISSVELDATHSAIQNYIVHLEPQREGCYNNILLLGTQNERQLQLLKIELNEYLNAILKLQNDIKYDNLIDGELNKSIELDKKFIEQTITAIETKDESYLLGISEIYYQILEYQRLMKVELVGDFTY